LDAHSDLIEQNVAGFCKNCMVLRANAEISNKDGKQLDLNDGIYTHHIVVSNLGRGAGIAPILPSMNVCKGSNSKSFEKIFGMSPRGGARDARGSSHQKRNPQASGGGFGPRGFSIFIAKGNEGDTSIFAPVNSTLAKSGYWIGEGDKMSAIAEIVNYNDEPREVFLAFDMEYLKFDGPRPSDYLDVSFGYMFTEQCGDINLRMLPSSI
jgi:hypothetical protein